MSTQVNNEVFPPGAASEIHGEPKGMMLLPADGERPTGRKRRKPEGGSKQALPFKSSLPPAKKHLPDFPQSAIRGSLGDLARVLANNTEVPEEFVFACLLTVIGALCVGKLTLEMAILVEPRLYTVLLGKSYDVRKSTALTKVLAFLAELLAGLVVLAGIGSAEGLAKFLSDKCHVLVSFDELRSFFDKAKIQGSVLLPMTTSLFEATKWDNPTKYSHISVKDGHLSILGCCTEDTYERMWTAEAVGIGFPNRLFVVWADRKPKVAWPEPPDPAQASAVVGRIKAQLQRLPQKLAIEAKAKELWQDWYEALPDSEHAKRLDTIGFRLMGVLALTMDKKAVDVEVIKTVIEILNYELAIRQATDPIGVDNRVAEVQEKIRRVLRNHPGITRSLLAKLVNVRRCGTHIFSKAIAGLITEEEVTCDQTHYWLIESGDGESPMESEERLPMEPA